MSETPRTDGVNDSLIVSLSAGPMDVRSALELTIEPLIAHGKLLERECAALTARLEEAEKRYQELIYAVAKKFPNESRHQTALRYIMEREQSSERSGAKAAQ